MKSLKTARDTTNPREKKITTPATMSTVVPACGSSSTWLPHPEEPCFSTASRRMAASSCRASILRDGRPRGRPPQDEVRISSHALLRDMTSFAPSVSVRRHILNQLLQGAEDRVNNLERDFGAELSGFVSICCYYHKCRKVVS